MVERKLHLDCLRNADQLGEGLQDTIDNIDCIGAGKFLYAKRQPRLAVDADYFRLFLIAVLDLANVLNADRHPVHHADDDILHRFDHIKAALSL